MTSFLKCVIKSYFKRAYVLGNIQRFALLSFVFFPQAMFFADQLLSKQGATASAHSPIRTAVRTELPVGSAGRARIT